MKPQTRRLVIAAIAVGVVGLTVLAPAEPPVGKSWSTVLGATLAGVLGLGGLAVAWYGGTLFRVGYSLRNRDADSVVNAADGQRVHIEGTARPHKQTLTSPVTGQDCLAHDYAVEEKQTRTAEQVGPNSENKPSETRVSWVKAAEGTEVVPFELETSNGTVLVDGDPSLQLTDDRTQEFVGGDADPPEPIAAFTDDPDRAAAPSSSIDLSDVVYDEPLRYTETLVLPGETVFVMGRGESTLQAGSQLNVDAIVTGSDGGMTDRLPDWLWRFDLFVADKPMDQTATAMWQFGAIGIGVGVVLLAAAAVIVL